MAYQQKKGRYHYVYVTMPPDADHDAKWVKCYTTDPETGQHWTTKTAAKNWGDEQERRVNRRGWVNPVLGRITWDEYWAKWRARLDVEPKTAIQYDYFYNSHIGPRYGTKPLIATDSDEVEEWCKALREGKTETGRRGRRVTRAYARQTVNGGIRMLMSMMLDDATQKPFKYLEANPLKTRPSPRRGKRVNRIVSPSRPKPVATPGEVLCLALNMHELLGPGTPGAMGAFVRVLTAGWTGMRPGEQAALDRANCDLGGSEPAIIVDDVKGNLEELSGAEPRLKAPKSGIGREVLLNLGLDALLRAWLGYLDGAIVFPRSPEVRWNIHYWNDRWEQARTGGTMTIVRPTPGGPRRRVEVTLPETVGGLEYKGLRRVHNTWLTEQGIPDVARSARLGHAMKDDLQYAYSQVSRVLEAQVLEALQALWVEAFSSEAGGRAIEVIRQFAPGFGGGARDPIELI